MADINQARQALNKLIETYKKNEHDKSFTGNEDQAGRSLIQPFIKEVLHWDIDDPSQFRVEPIQNGKRMDYLIRNNGISQFVVEAKKISTNIFDDETIYKQAIGYARGKERDFAIATNFKQFVILRCDVDIYPLQAAIAKIDTFSMTEDELKLLLCFEQNYWLKSGKNNELYNKLAHFKKREPIGDELVDEMRKWRNLLSTNVRANSKYNKFNFDDKEEKKHIEEEIQNFIDRLIFICFCEDKELEDRELNNLIEGKERFWDKQGYLLNKLRELFRIYDEHYDSDLFEKSDCDSLVIDDAKLLSILIDLRHPRGKIPPDFESIDPDILGKAYEQFIGHEQTGEKRIKEKEDINKRKKEGIFYTPQYIVEYIVNNAVREYTKGKSSEEIKKIKIVDPACGSGSFLIKAFDVLVEESENRLKRKLTYDEKRDLMLNCIFGVDLDRRAVQIAKLRLSLKLAEPHKSLPMLGDNIQQGNSLIDDKDITKINGSEWDAFKWEERFKDIFKQGGFDIVIGNPPYIFARGENFDEREKSYYYKNYKLQEYQINTYSLFVEKAQTLLKTKGTFGFIIPNNWLTISTFTKFRKNIFDDCANVKIVNIYDKVFKEANVDTCILIFNKLKSNTISVAEIQEGKFELIKNFKANDFKKSDNIINISSLKDNFSNKIMNKIENISINLNEISEVSTGLKAYQVGKGKPKQTKDIRDSRKYHSKEKLGADYIKYLEGKDVGRYSLSWSGEYLKYGDHLAEPRKSVPFKGERILVRQIPSKLPYCINATLVNEEVLHDINSMVIFNFSKDYAPELILGIINSKLTTYWFFNKFGKLQRNIFPQFKVNELGIFPIIKKSDKRISETIIGMINKRILLSKQRIQKTSNQNKIEEEIKNTDKEIDELVYKLYSITEEEEKIIEESLK